MEVAQIHLSLKKDLSNLIRGTHRKSFGCNVQTTIDYFKSLQQENPLFYYDIKVDENNIAQHLFWVDEKSRLSHDYFWDVVTFDTTYMTNKY